MIANMLTWKAWELSSILPFTNEAQNNLNIALIIEITKEYWDVWTQFLQDGNCISFHLASIQTLINLLSTPIQWATWG